MIWVLVIGLYDDYDKDYVNIYLIFLVFNIFLYIFLF